MPQSYPSNTSRPGAERRRNHPPRPMRVPTDTPPAKKKSTKAAYVPAAAVTPELIASPSIQPLQGNGFDVIEVAADGPIPSFAQLGVPSELVNVLSRRGIETPFPIQVATMPDAMAGRDVLGRGQTGSGKTLAFGLPMLARLTGGSQRLVID